MHESHIEQVLIEYLVAQGYQYFFGPDIAPFSATAERESFETVFLDRILMDSLRRLNPDLPDSAITEAYARIRNLGSHDLMENNERFHNFLTD